MAQQKKFDHKTGEVRPDYNPKNKEQGSQKNKKRRKKQHKKPVDIDKKLEQLQAHINGEYHSP